MKYITYTEENQVKFVVFTGTISHPSVAKMHGIIPNRIRSAGFICRTSSGMRCWGRSVSLDVDSHPDDSRIATEVFSGT